MMHNFGITTHLKYSQSLSVEFEVKRILDLCDFCGKGFSPSCSLYACMSGQR